MYESSFLSGSTSSTACFWTCDSRNKYQNSDGHNIHPVFGEETASIFDFTSITCFTFTFNFLNKTGRVRTLNENFFFFDTLMKLNSIIGDDLIANIEYTHTCPNSDCLTNTSVLNSSSASLSMPVSLLQTVPLPDTVCKIPSTAPV